MLLIGLVSALLTSSLTPAAGAAQSAQPAPPNHLQPGDKIVLRIWREENMSGEFRVDAEGMVVFPRLGPWPVRDKDATALKAELIEAYARYLRTPAVEVTFLRRINVGGAVQRPGVYYIDPTMTVRDALLEAGGPTPLGRTDRVELIRDGNRIQARVHQDLPIVESPVQSGDQLHVPERSWLSRNTNAAVGIGSALLGFIATMIILSASDSGSN
jgi:protein involved in polysaccharide export with SLBB domain